MPCLSEDLKREFLRKYFLLFIQILDFVGEDAFNIKASIFYNKFCHYPAVNKFIDEKLILNKEKTVAFFTKYIFTSDHTSSQRSESLNSLLKGLEE